MTCKVAPEATVTPPEPRTLLLDATSVPLLVTTRGRLKPVFAPFNTSVPASNWTVPFMFALDIFPLKVRVLPVPATKRFVTPDTPLLITKLLVIVAEVFAFVAHSLLVKSPKVEV